MLAPSLAAICGVGCPWTALHAVGSSILFTSDSPLPNLPELLAGDNYRIALAAAESSASPPSVIGTGPFQFTSISSSVLTLAANDNCW